MLYVVVDEDGKEKVLLVKADNESEVERMLKLTESQHIEGVYTSHEVNTLVSATFAVIRGNQR